MRIILCLSLLLSESVVYSPCFPYERNRESNETIFFCNQVLDEDKLVLEEVPSNQFTVYKIPTKNIAELTQSVSPCILDEEHSLRFRFERITRVSDVTHLPRASTFLNTTSIQVTLLKGRKSYECKHRDDTSDLGRIFASFSCYREGNYNPAGMLVNAVEIKSDVRLAIDASYLIELLGLMPMQRTDKWCVPPALYPRQKLLGDVKQMYEVGDKVGIACTGLMKPSTSENRTCLQTGNWSGEAPLCVSEEYPLIGLLRGRNFSTSTVSKDHVINIRLDRDYVDVEGLYLKLDVSHTSQSEIEDYINSKISFYITNNATGVDMLKLKSTKLSSPMLRMWSLPDNITDLNRGTVIHVFLRAYSWKYWILSSIVMKVNADPEGKKEFRRFAKHCPPIETYPGVPDAYFNYELVLNGSINRLLEESPCSQGYFLNMKAGERIYQCTNRTWKGTVPRCNVMRTRSPPEVKNATWDYVFDDVFHQVLYTYTDGHDSTNSTLATYNAETDDWTGVPKCDSIPPTVGVREGDVQDTTSASSHGVAIWLGIAFPLIAVICLVVYLWWKCYSNSCLQLAPAQEKPDQNPAEPDSGDGAADELLKAQVANQSQEIDPVET